MPIFENDSGKFITDPFGTLLDFECAPKNRMRDHNSPNAHYPYHFHIPEGVRSIAPHTFRCFRVFRELTFPDSLVSIGEGAFSKCTLGEVTLPRYAQLSDGVFSGSRIREIRFPHDMNPALAIRAAHLLRCADCYTFSSGWPKAYEDVLFGRHESYKDWQYIRNSSGGFYVDSDGVLRDFSCDQDNLPIKTSSEAAKSTYLRLQIPEGVRVIPGGMFERIQVLWEMTLPSSLICLGIHGSNAFAASLLPDITLSENLALLGAFAFGNATIRSLTIPPTLMLSHYESMRDFKDALIGEIRVPVSKQKDLEETCRMYRHGSDEFQSGTYRDPKYGDMCFVRAVSGSLSGNLLPHLFQKIAIPDA